MDWQTIGIWLTGVALAAFAALTWKLSKRQQQIMYGSDLEVYAHYDPPITGHNVFIRKEDGCEIDYDGIVWELSVVNPGSIPIVVKSTIVSIRSAEAGKSIQIWPGDCCNVFQGASETEKIIEARPRFTVMAGKAFVTSIVIHSSRWRQMLQDVGSPNATFTLEVKFTWEVARRSKETLITSQEVTLPENVPFGFKPTLI